MRDGVRMAAHVFRPDADGRFPESCCARRTTAQNLDSSATCALGTPWSPWTRAAATAPRATGCHSPWSTPAMLRMATTPWSGWRRSLGATAWSAPSVPRTTLDAVAASQAAPPASGGHVRVHHPTGVEGSRLAGRVPAGTAHQVVAHLHDTGPTPPARTATATHAGASATGVGQGRRRGATGSATCRGSTSPAATAGAGGVREGLARAPEPTAWKFDEVHKEVAVPNLDFSGWYDHCNGSMQHLQLMQRHGRTERARSQTKLVAGRGITRASVAA